VYIVFTRLSTMDSVISNVFIIKALNCILLLTFLLLFKTSLGTFSRTYLIYLCLVSIGVIPGTLFAKSSPLFI
jgi:hypothetical protein